MENNHCISILVLYIMSCGYFVVGELSVDCTFDDGFCYWIHLHNTYYLKLMWGRQNTPTSNIGPTSDHTSGVGSFIYINSSNELANEKARLSLPWLKSGTYCLSFWYYMHGRDTDILRITLQEEDWLRVVFYKTTDQRKRWSFQTILFTTSTDFKIHIDGFIETDTDDFGYIAVDDVQMFPNQCPKHCPDPTPDFGKIGVGDFWEGSAINITCKEGYGIKGNSSIVCLDNQEWSDTPMCQPVDCNTPMIGTFMSVITPENTTFNTTIMLSCSRGSTLIGNRSITCMANGTWSSLPRCIINNCGKPVLDQEILYDPPGNTTFNTMIQLSCLAGFTLIGNSSITCMANGTWSNIPRCVINKCSDPTPRSGKVSSTDFKVGSIVQVICATGYKLIGDPLIVCQTDSTWSDNQVCQRIECSKPILTKGLLEPNATTWYTNQFLILACVEGTTMKGDAKIIFQDNGNWTILPTCLTEESGPPRSLIAVIVTIPVLSVVFLVITIVVTCRKRKAGCMKGDKTRNEEMNLQTHHSSNTNCGLVRDSSLVDGQNTEYSVISRESPAEMKDVVYYNDIGPL